MTNAILFLLCVSRLEEVRTGLFAYSVQRSLTVNNLAVRIFSIRYYGNLYRYKPGKSAGVSRSMTK